MAGAAITVTRVVDGDTIDTDGGTIRIFGFDFGIVVSPATSGHSSGDLGVAVGAGPTTTTAWLVTATVR